MPNCKSMTLEGLLLNILVLGQQKTGKTWLVGTFPGLPYVFDFDDGIKTLIGKDIEYDTFVETNPKQPMAWKNTQTRLEEFEKSAKADGVVKYEGRTIDLISVDGSTELLNIMMNQILYINGRLGGMPQQNDWGPQMGAYVRFINRIKALPCHCVVIAHERIVEQEHTGIVKTLPAVTGKETLAPTLGGKFDIIFRAETKKVGQNVQYRLLTQNQGIYEAGHRFGDAFDVYEEPDLARILEKIEAYRKRVTAVS